MSNLPCKLVRWKARRKKNGLDLSLFFNLGYKWKLSWSSVSMFGLFCFPIGCVISVHFLFIEGKEIIWSHKSWSWQIYWGGKGWTKTLLIHTSGGCWVPSLSPYIHPWSIDLAVALGSPRLGDPGSGRAWPSKASIKSPLGPARTHPSTRALEVVTPLARRPRALTRHPGCRLPPQRNADRFVCLVYM